VDDYSQWVIEGHGVDPDIEVENDPASILAGRDPQLERGVEEVLKRMEAHPMKLPSQAPPPNKAKTPEKSAVAQPPR
jgi:tricorn protease